MASANRAALSILLNRALRGAAMVPPQWKRA
jgi:hypothetical protein